MQLFRLLAWCHYDRWELALHSNLDANLVQVQVIGVMGCMAERLKAKLLNTHKLADIVVGPDAYRDLPRLLQAVQVSSLALSQQNGLLVRR